MFCWNPPIATLPTWPQLQPQDELTANNRSQNRPALVPAPLDGNHNIRYNDGLH